MMFGLSPILTRIGIGITALVLLIGFLQIRSCAQARQEAAKARVERRQANATVDSAKDSIVTQGAVAGREKGSDNLTRSNSEEIKSADGATVTIHPDVSAAGRDSLCRRAAYRGSEYCLQRAAAARVAEGR